MHRLGTGLDRRRQVGGHGALALLAAPGSRGVEQHHLHPPSGMAQRSQPLDQCEHRQAALH